MTEDEQNEQWMLGYNAAWKNLLKKAIKELHGEDLTLERLIAERADAIQTLRDVCGEFGDNNWQDNLHLSDIIEKHLRRHLEND